MVTVDQIKLLESKVRSAVDKIVRLKEENNSLRGALNKYESRIQELEKYISDFKDSQTEIEKGIVNALNQLDSLEDQTMDSVEGEQFGTESAPAQTSGGEEPIRIVPQGNAPEEPGMTTDESDAGDEHQVSEETENETQAAPEEEKEEEEEEEKENDQDNSELDIF
jgi:hypothetical protein